ncbi:MAG: hypothetical protein A3F12_06725 [Gammaproteobacteria bacterium RIFCSPHIGHO2_12_FULL_38_14]|nr:MAG: hypothetical protein A3F12_06725 [Gammaproteobacteria bacterium RIFCSPHIGHO2_12_FULL_38_14]
MNKDQYFLLPIFLLIIFSYSNKLFAASGPYAGIQFGLANMHQGSYIAKHLNNLVEDQIPGASTEYLDMIYDDTGFAGRLFAGYQFNSYLAIETGYTQFQKLSVNTSAGIQINVINLPIPADITTHAAVSTDVFDLVGKVILPVTNRFSIYGKLGLAYLNVNGQVKATANIPDVLTVDASANPNLHILYPEAALGINYEMTKKISMDCSLTRIQQYNSHVFPNIDFLSVGIIYHW